MRRFTALLLALSLLLVGAACQRRDLLLEQEESPSESESEPEVEPEPEPNSQPDSSVESEEEPEPVDTEGARKAAEEMLAALKTGNKESIQAHVDYKNLLQLEYDGQSDANALQILTHLQYEIVDVDAKKESATVTVKLTNVDMTAMLADYLKNAMEMEYNNAISDEPLSDEEMERAYQQLFTDTLSDNSGNTTTRTVDLQLLLYSSGWSVQANEALRDGAMGGYFTAQKQVGNNAGGGQG